MTRKKVFTEIFKVFLLIAAGAINAFGVVSFLLPSRILDSGISGLSLLLSATTKVPLSVFIISINIPFFLIGLKKQGARFIINSLVAIASYSIFSYIFDSVVDLDTIMFGKLSSDLFICAVFGALISGLGSGLTIKLGGAIDGIEVLSVIFAKKLSLTVGQFIMIFNVIIYTIACFTIGIHIGLFSIVTYAIGLKAVDFVADGLDKAKGCNIITSKGDEVAKILTERLGIGLTFINAKGYYSGEETKLVYCVVNRFEINKLKTLVSEVDPHAFITISEVSEVVRSTIEKPQSLKDVPPDTNSPSTNADDNN